MPKLAVNRLRSSRVILRSGQSHWELVCQYEHIVKNYTGYANELNFELFLQVCPQT